MRTAETQNAMGAGSGVKNGRIEHALGWHLPDLSAFEFRLVIQGDPVSLKNSKKAVRVKGRLLFVPSSKVSAWMKQAALQLMCQWQPIFREPIPLSIQLNAKIVSYLPTRRLTDASNLYQGPEDVLQGICITDDSQIEAHDGSRRLYDPENPRVEVTLSRFQP